MSFTHRWHGPMLLLSMRMVYINVLLSMLTPIVFIVSCEYLHTQLMLGNNNQVQVTSDSQNRSCKCFIIVHQ